MKETAGPVIALLAGLVLAGIVMRRIASGKSFSTYPLAALSRTEDPFSFWLSLLFPGGIGIALIIGGVAGLWYALH